MKGIWDTFGKGAVNVFSFPIRHASQINNSKRIPSANGLFTSRAFASKVETVDAESDDAKWMRRSTFKKQRILDLDEVVF